MRHINEEPGGRLRRMLAGGTTIKLPTHPLMWADLEGLSPPQPQRSAVQPGTNKRARAPAPHEKQPLDTAPRGHGDRLDKRRGGDRKSTRLNSSHLGISYAV